MTRVLIVDDDQSTLASLSRAFRLAGYEAVVCDHAARAIALLQQERFDIVFSDVVMPGKDGLAMLADLRELGVTTPVIMISGQATVDMAVRATRLGAADFLEKPISSDKLLLTVENTLRHVIEIVPGTVAFFPKGWKGTCRVHETIRKAYMIT